MTVQCKYPGNVTLCSVATQGLWNHAVISPSSGTENSTWKWQKAIRSRWAVAAAGFQHLLSLVIIREAIKQHLRSFGVCNYTIQIHNTIQYDCMWWMTEHWWHCELGTCSRSLHCNSLGEVSTFPCCRPSTLSKQPPCCNYDDETQTY